MAVSGDYPKPVTVNGFSCRNCQEVSMAKRFIDPEHPLSGPYGVSAGSDPTVSPAKRTETENKNLFRPDGMGQRLDISV